MKRVKLLPSSATKFYDGENVLWYETRFCVYVPTEGKIMRFSKKEVASLGDKFRKMAEKISYKRAQKKIFQYEVRLPGKSLSEVEDALTRDGFTGCRDIDCVLISCFESERANLRRMLIERHYKFEEHILIKQSNK